MAYQTMKERSVISLFLWGWIIAIGDGFSSPVAKLPRSSSSRTIHVGEGGRTHSLSSVVAKSSDDDSEEALVPTIDVVKKVAVAGATGKTGKLVVDELLNRNVQVVGLIRNETKAAELFGDYSSDMLDIKECNLANPEDIASALVGCDATIWCATGFSDGATNSQMPPTGTISPDQSIDVMGIPAVANVMLQNHGSEGEQTAYPKVVMLSR